MLKLMLLLLSAGCTHAQFVATSTHRKIFTAGGGPCTPASGFLHCRSLTITPGQVTGSLTSFPVLVRLTLGASRIQNANCFDLAFTSDVGGTARIPWEIEQCTPETGALVAWVLAPSVFSGAAFYMSYDNAAITTAQNTGPLAPAAIWSGFTAVWHFATNGSSLTTSDSSPNGNNLANSGSVAPIAGQIAGAASLSGSNHLDGADYPSIDGATKLTISFWINPNSVAAFAGIFSKWTGTGLFLETTGSSGETVFNLGGGNQAFDPPGYLAVGVWAHLAFVFDGTAMSWAEYVNGSPVSTVFNGAAPASVTGNTAIFQIGSLDGSRINGAIDEFRIAAGVAQSAAWIAAEHNNQQTSSTFVTIGSEV